jgi:ATP-dependent DNA helicase RecG
LGNLFFIANTQNSYNKNVILRKVKPSSSLVCLEIKKCQTGVWQYAMKLQTKIEFLKGVGPTKAAMLQKELGIFTFGDLLQHYPFRYIDKTKFHRISDITADTYDSVQLRGILRRVEVIGDGHKRRLVAKFRDPSGALDLVWFKGIHFIEKQLVVGAEYVVYGKAAFFGGQPNIAHPEIELVTPNNTELAPTMDAVYPTTEKLKGKGLDPKGIRKLIEMLLKELTEEDVAENLPDYVVKKLRFPSRLEALRFTHQPTNNAEMVLGRNRLKFEELFLMQIKILQTKGQNQIAYRGWVFDKIGENFNHFYHNKLKFELTGAQKRVLREIRKDLGSGVQMNRLLQGDVGSGKTICALMSILMALDNGFQACLMAPTEILAQQHFDGISEDLEGMDITVGFLVGSVKGKKRKLLFEQLANGEIDILIGTHALIEDPVIFKNLGLAIIDEQHRFGVQQRSKLWRKSKPNPPHVLVMTATPIPRTLAMTVYGDLDVSVIDEMPPGRLPVITVHRNESHRLRVFGFMREQITKGHQVYIVYPLIEESETLDLNNLMEGYESISREFPIPQYQLSILHGKMKPADKDFEMQRFIKNETQIMVATTVIEVGVNVPNATMMIIENTERFGLAQLHQLRGRVGRGGGEAYCILMSSYKLSNESRHRIKTMCETNNGFEISEADLKLRGPGNITGTQQSGILNLKIADLVKDGKILSTAREIAKRIVEDDIKLERPEHLPLREYMDLMSKMWKGWSMIS